MAELGQAGNITTAGVPGGGALLDFGSVRVQIPPGSQLRLDAVDTKLVRVDTAAGRIDLCVLAAPRSSSLWSRMSREVAASQTGKGARVRTEAGEWGEEVLAVRDGQLSRYVASDGPGWMLFGLALGPEETTVELGATLRSMMRSCLVRRGNEPLPEKTPLPMTVPPGLGYSGDSPSSRSDRRSEEEDGRSEEAQSWEAQSWAGQSEVGRSGAGRSGVGRQAGPVFQLGPTDSARRATDRARATGSGHGPTTRPGAVARHGSATRHGSPARSGPSRDNRAPAAPSAAPSPDQHRGRWIRAGQVSLVLGVVACLAVMVGWLLNGPGAAQVHYTPAMALPPNAAGSAPGTDLALGNLPEKPPGSAAEGQPSQSAPELAPNSGQVAAPNASSPNTLAPNRATPNQATPNQATPNQATTRHPAEKPATQAPARSARVPARSGRSVTSVPQHRAPVQAPTTHSGDESTSRDDDDSTSADDRHSDHSSRSGSSSDDSDHRDHHRNRDGATPLGGVTRTLGGLGLPIGG